MAILLVSLQYENSCYLHRLREAVALFAIVADCKRSECKAPLRASDGDTLALGVPNARTTGGGTIVYFAWVSAANSVAIQGCNISAAPQKTAGSGAIRVDLWKH